jgi:hypothetical protein
VVLPELTPRGHQQSRATSAAGASSEHAASSLRSTVSPASALVAPVSFDRVFDQYVPSTLPDPAAEALAALALAPGAAGKQAREQLKQHLQAQGGQ